MDIYFCDECGTRVSDLDLRGGKGMRRCHDTICSSCVDLGHAPAWLERTAAAAPAKPVVKANGTPAAAAPSLIDVARDRARTAPDDPFVVDEPLPPKRPAAHETAAIAAKPAAKPAKPAKVATPQPVDGLAAAGGSFGALADAGALRAPPPGLVDDDPEDSAGSEDDDDAPSARTPARADSPFDYAAEEAPANPGKAETAEIPAGAKGESEPEPKSGKSSSGRHSSQRRAASSKRPSTKTTRRVTPSAMASKKVMLLSLVSCVIMVIVFFGVVLPNVSKAKDRKPAEVQRIELLDEFAKFVREADSLSKTAIRSPDDMDAQEKAKAAIRTMSEQYYVFEAEAKKKGWGEDAFEQQLHNMGFNDIKGRLKAINERHFILQQQRN